MVNHPNRSRYSGKRFKVEPNGAGGWHILDKREQKRGSCISHRRNAEIACSRCNGERDMDQEWIQFYGFAP